MKPIQAIATDLGIRTDDLIPYGTTKAKISLAALGAGSASGRLVLVSAMTPTPAGEGKTTTAIALAQGLSALGRRACVVLPEPSLGPLFGRKGGATGGGRSALVPADDINLHFTGDIHAVTSAHDLAALLDNHLYWGNRLGIDTRRVLWRRVVDMNDRALRHIVIGMGGTTHGIPRQSGFDITAASEVMAALYLAEGYDDLRRRLQRMVVALTPYKEPVTAADLKGVGGMLVLLRDALCPNLVQTIEGTPAIVHGGPFANVAHGCSSVLATKLALDYSDWVITETGFGFDLGGEKFFDLTSVAAGLETAVVVLVASVRALKRHGQVEPAALTRPDASAVSRGLPNLAKQVENVRCFGNTPVVALNQFESDTDAEIDVVRHACERLGAPFVVCQGFSRGAAGAVDLAEGVVRHAEQHHRPFVPLYDWSTGVYDKLTTIATSMYGAGSVIWDARAERDLEVARVCGAEGLPLCVAKTHASLSDDPTRVGCPEGFPVTVNRLLLAAGAGYLVPVLGRIERMPGLPAAPQAEQIDLTNGDRVGVASHHKQHQTPR